MQNATTRPADMPVTPDPATPIEKDPTPSMRKMLCVIHAVGALVSLVILLIMFVNWDEKHTLHVEMYIETSTFRHPCDGDSGPTIAETGGSYAGCLDGGKGVDKAFVVVPGEEKLASPFETIPPIAFVIVAAMVGMVYHGILAFNFAFADTDEGKGLKSLYVRKTSASKYFGNYRNSLKTLRYLHNVFIGVPLVWSIMAIVGVGSFFDYILTAAAQIGLFNSLAVWDRSKSQSSTFDAINYLLVGFFLCWYLFSAVNHEEDALSDGFPKHGNLVMVVVVHAVYLFLYAAHLVLLRASAFGMASMLEPLGKAWDVQVDIGYSILNVGYLLTTSVGVYANYKAICGAVMKDVYPETSDTPYEDNTDYYQVQLITTIITSIVVLLVVLLQTGLVRGVIRGNETAKWLTCSLYNFETAEKKYGYVKSKFSNNAQPHEGAPILGSQYTDDDEC